MFNLIRRDPSNLFTSLRKELEEFDNLADRIMHFHGFPTLRGIEAPAFSPSLDFNETEKDYILALETPGMTQKDVKISLDSETDILTIEGEKLQKEEQKDEKKHIQEIAYGRFKRELCLPKDSNKEDLKASYKNGILTIFIPKLKIVEPEKKRIDIKVE
ncbi:MAG TPA: Hsp20/alpha crystallin family protein [Bacillota bacterium]|nr:Hsp20/alpha crystallin family protein [Bacillota bacterium]